MPSVIRRFHYDEPARRLTIVFVSGQVYAYDAVSPDTVEGLGSAASKGRFFAANIRGRYRYARLEAAPEG